MSLRSGRRRLRLFKSIELTGSGLSVNSNRDGAQAYVRGDGARQKHRG